MATLFGIVFFSHQVSSFPGIWMGGLFYEACGSYDAVWWMAVALGVFAALIQSRSSSGWHPASSPPRPEPA